MFSNFKENMKHRSIRIYFIVSSILFPFFIYLLVIEFQNTKEEYFKEADAKVIIETKNVICFQSEGNGYLSTWCVEKNHKEYIVRLIEARG